MARQSEQKGYGVNIPTIKRIDPYAKEIVDRSDHVAIFKFDKEKNKWDTTVVEASIFIYSRYAEPYHSLFISYHSNAESSVEPITSHTKLKIDPPFMFFKNEQNRT